jgi:hypothetical protein
MRYPEYDLRTAITEQIERCPCNYKPFVEWMPDGLEQPDAENRQSGEDDGRRHRLRQADGAEGRKGHLVALVSHHQMERIQNREEKW